MDVVNSMDENEVKEILESHDDRIKDLEISYGRMDERLNNIEQSQARLENTVLQGQNAILTTLQSLVLNNTQKEIAQDKNKTDLQITKENNKVGLYGKLLVIVAAFFSGSKASDIWIAIKELFK